MVYLYDQYENEFRNLDEVKGALIHGLNDESKMIKDTMAKFWNDKNRLDHDPLTRLQQLMDNMYNNDEEAIWLIFWDAGPGSKPQIFGGPSLVDPHQWQRIPNRGFCTEPYR